MPSAGCRFPINAAVVCGDWSVLTSTPFLCPACQAGRAMLASVGLSGGAQALREARIAAGACEGCLEAPATSTRPNLCQLCREDYARDLATEDVIEGNPGSRCTSACGPCGRCG